MSHKLTGLGFAHGAQWCDARHTRLFVVRGILRTNAGSVPDGVGQSFAASCPGDTFMRV